MLFLHRQIKPSYYLQCQRGVVIVLALFIVALVAAMAYVMLARIERDTQRVGLLLHDIQAEQYAQGSIAWAIDQLRYNWQTKTAQRAVDVVPITSPVNTVHRYKISSTIYDMQARFNINNMVETECRHDFKRLLLAVNTTLSEEKAKEIADAVLHWITPRAEQHSLDKYYATVSPPYRAAHRLMVSPSELTMVKGMTPSLFQALRPYITALPTSTAVNVQTAASPVLATLSENITLAAAKQIEQWRKFASMVSVTAFLNSEMIKNHPVLPKKITDKSTYFLVETTVSIEKQQIIFYTLLERINKGGEAIFNIIWQSKGGW